jgi:hypothetical protein
MAASLTQLTGGNFQDANGNVLAYGYLTLKLSQDGNVSGVGNICSGVTITIQLDVNGNVASLTSPTPVANQYVWANSNISPINTYYKVTGYTQEGQRAFGLNNQQVAAGATFNVGTWVPNSVISWFPNPQTVTLEVNGVAASSQIVQNLEAGANITITDEGSGNIQIAASSGGASFDGNGAFFFGPGITDLSLIGGTDAVEGTANLNGSTNAVQVYLFELLAEFTISKASQLALNSSFGVHGYAGIYSYSGNLLVNAGQFLYEAASGIQTNTFTPVTLPPGVYWHAQATDDGGHGQWVGVTVTSGADSAFSLLTKNATRAATAANAVSGSSLPATLGTLTPFTPSTSNSDSIMCPLYE